MANRHLMRTVALQALYEWDFNLRKENLDEVTANILTEFAGGAEDNAFAYELVHGVTENLEAIDAVIVKTAPEWPIPQINVIDRNVLRIGIFELMFAKKIPPKVAINEAVEMGKRFGGDSSGKFVNGVLGTLYKNLSPEEMGPEESDYKKDKAAGESGDAVGESDALGESDAAAFAETSDTSETLETPEVPESL